MSAALIALLLAKSFAWRSKGKNDMVERLEDMLEEAGDEKEREAIRKCIQRLR